MQIYGKQVRFAKIGIATRAAVYRLGMVSLLLYNVVDSKAGVCCKPNDEDR